MLYQQVLTVLVRSQFFLPSLQMRLSKTKAQVGYFGTCAGEEIVYKRTCILDLWENTMGKPMP